jgi:hypothetical protein
VVTRSTDRRRSASLAITTLVALAPTLAFAQAGADAIVRRDLLDQAERARRAGDHPTAIDRALRALTIQATPSVHYFLAREYDLAAQPLAALEQAGACARGAEADVALRNRAALLGACRLLVTQNEARVGHVTVRFTGEAVSGVTVRVAGATLRDAVIGVPYPVPAGAVRVEASAPEHEDWSREVTVAAGENVDVEVSLTPTPPPPPPPPPPPVTIAPVTIAPVAIAAPVRPPPSRSVVPLVVGGAVSAASFVTAGALFAASLGARSDRDGACRGTPVVCDASSLDDDARYRTYTWATDVAVGVGAASLLAGAIVWWRLRPSEPTARGSIALLPLAFARDAWGATLVVTR